MDIVDVNAFAQGAKRKPAPPFGPLSSFIPGVAHPLYGGGAPFAHIDRLKGPKVIVMRHPKERRQTFKMGAIPRKPIDDWLRDEFGMAYEAEDGGEAAEGEEAEKSAPAKGNAARQAAAAAEAGGEEEEGGEEEDAAGEEEADGDESAQAEEEDEE
jgi:hypothetical protein